MNNDLLPYYQNELAFVRNLAKEFAEDHAGVADQLNLNAQSGESQDPHVERMIQAFAFLTGRIRKKLDDDFPEVAGALLGMLYPHSLAPLPSMAIVEFQLDRAQATLTDGYPIGRGQQLETEPVDGEVCHYRTCYPVTLWPFEVLEASLAKLPFAPGLSVKGAGAWLRIRLRCFAKEMDFGKLKLNSIRVFLNGQAQHVLALYELISNHLLALTVAPPGSSASPTLLRNEHLRPVGFAEPESVLPWSPRSHPGYRLLTEYFAFPQKFYFFDLCGLTDQVRAGLGNELEFCFYLDQTNLDLEHNISRNTFRLGCTPMINLFAQRADPIRLTQEETQYRVVADRRRSAEACEIYSIDAVTATSPDGDRAVYQPFYSLRHATSRGLPQLFWFATRSPSSRTEHQVDSGTEIYLSLVDLGLSPHAPANWTVEAETLCFNRDLPARLPAGGQRPSLSLTEGGPVSSISCLTAPTPTRRPSSDRGLMWRLISHLSLNHLSLTGGPEGADALREILRLHDHVDSPETQAKLAGIRSVTSQRVIRRLPADVGDGVCRGILAEIELDEDYYADNGLFLFAAVLERFLGLYASVNSFIQLSIRGKQRDRTLKTWKPRIREREAV